MGVVSAGTFVVLAMTVGGYNPQITKVVVADALCLVALAAGGAALLFTRSSVQA